MAYSTVPSVEPPSTTRISSTHAGLTRGMIVLMPSISLIVGNKSVVFIADCFRIDQASVWDQQKRGGGLSSRQGRAALACAHEAPHGVERAAGEGRADRGDPRVV